MTKRKIIFILLPALLHILCIFYLICNTLIFYDYPYLLPLTPLLHITICLIIFKKEKAAIIALILTALFIIAILFVSKNNIEFIKFKKELTFGEDYVNSECIKIRDLKNDSNDSAGIIRYYNNIMTNEYFKYIEKELYSNKDVYLLEYDYNNFFFEGNAECFYERIYSKYLIEENDYVDYGKSKAFVNNLDSGIGEIIDIKEFCIKNGTEVIHGIFWGDIDKEDLLKKIEEFYF